MQIVEPISKSGASNVALAQIEAMTGSRLPEDYRRFLTTFNGGRPNPARFVFQTQDGQSDSAVQFFFTLDPYSVQENVADYAGRIPSGLLPVACDSFGNLILLDLGVKNFGGIYFWDHERESMDDVTWENVYYVAPTFTDFVNGLL